MKLLGVKDVIQFAKGGSAARFPNVVPIFRNENKDQRQIWPDGKTPSWAQLYLDLIVARSAYFLVTQKGDRVLLEILTGRLLLRVDRNDDRHGDGHVLWLSNIRYATNFDRKRFLLSGVALQHKGIVIDIPSELGNRARQEGFKITNVVRNLFQTFDEVEELKYSEREEDESNEEKLGEEEFELAEALALFVDAEHELEERAVQAEGGFHYYAVENEAARGRFKSRLRFSLVESDWKRLKEISPPIQMLKLQNRQQQSVLLNVESSEENFYVSVSTSEQGGMLEFPSDGILYRAATDTLKRIRRDTLEKLRENATPNKWLLKLAARTKPLDEYDDSPLPHSEAIAKLNPSQKTAVAKGFDSPDITLVLGPPGTGKTTVIATWVEKFVQEGKKVLITSQNNKAVDNVLERLKKDKSLNCVRLGNEGKVSLEISELLIDNRAIGLQKQMLTGIQDSMTIFAQAKVKIEKIIPQFNVGKNIETLIDDLSQWLAWFQTMPTGFQMLFDAMEKYYPSALSGLKSRYIASNKAQEKIAILRSKSGIFSLFSKISAWFLTRKAVPLQVKLLEHQSDLKLIFEDMLLVLNLLSPEVNSWRTSFSETRQEELYAMLIKLVDVVGATCIGVNSSKHFRDVDFDVVIVDESGQIQLHNLIVPMSRATKVILVGDHKQLPPIAQEELLDEIKERSETTAFERTDELMQKSWFELAWRDLPESRRAILDTQFRCPAIISDFISEAFYESKYFAGEAMKTKMPILPSFTSPMVFVDTSMLELGKRRERTRKLDNRNEVLGNVCETEILLKLLAELALKLPDIAESGEIGIIVPYKAHAAEVQRRIDLEKRKGGLKNLRTPTNELVATVDSYQGQERDIILFAFTRSNPMGSVGFLADWRRLNVAMTRTKRQLVMVGDLSTLTKSTRNPDDVEFKKAMQLMQKRMMASNQIIGADSIERVFQ